MIKVRAQRFRQVIYKCSCEGNQKEIIFVDRREKSDKVTSDIK